MMQHNDFFSLDPLPPEKVPSRGRRLVLIALVWLVGLGFVTAAQIELDSIDAAGVNAAESGTGPARAQAFARLSSTSIADRGRDRSVAAMRAPERSSR